MTKSTYAVIVFAMTLAMLLSSCNRSPSVTPTPHPLISVTPTQVESHTPMPSITPTSTPMPPDTEITMPSGALCSDVSDLIKTKIRILAGDPTFQSVYDRYLQEANTALEAGPFSVVHKSAVPPSGDKHDYLSYALRWWPNPETEDGLPYVRGDKQNPELVTLNHDDPAMGDMVSAVTSLARAYYLTGVETYAEHAIYLLRVWFLYPTTKMNPNLEYAFLVPGDADGKHYGIIRTRVLIYLVNAISFLSSSDNWKPEDYEGLVAWFDEYLQWLQTSEFGQRESKSENNHGTWYDVQVACFAHFVGEDDLARSVVESSKERRITVQIEPDGRQPYELDRSTSLFYSLHNLNGLFRLAEIGEQVKVDLWHYETEDGRGLRKALDFVAPYAGSEATWPYTQTTKVDASYFASILRRAADVYEGGGYEQYLEKIENADH